MITPRFSSRGIRTAAAADRGLTLIEVVVAMFIFAIISTGALYTMGQIISVTRDSRAKQVAANLAAQEIDLVRAADDLFAIQEIDYRRELNGDTFRVHRDTDFVNGSGTDVACGGGGAGVLKYKRVNVTVTWDGARDGAQPVRADTVITPQSRINDPDLGTILVSTLSAAGTGSSGVTVSASPASPANGAVPLTVTPSPTGSDGCSYILKVTPGNYNVTVTRAASIDGTLQATTATQLTQVTMGASTSVGFAYDYSGSFRVNYATNYPAMPKVVPLNLDTSFLKGDSIFVAPQTAAALTRDYALFPHQTGYDFMAGKYVAPSQANAGCISVDPAAWPAGIEAGKPLVGTRTSAAAAPAGPRVPVNLPMGVVSVRGVNNANNYLKAVSAAPLPLTTADPGCDVPMTYTFGPVLGNSAANTTAVALPFGSWKLYYGGSASQTNLLGVTSITPLTRGSVGLLDSVLTLDPRTVTP